MNFSLWLRRAISRLIGKLQVYETYPLETFNALSVPIIAELQKVPRMEIDKVYSCVGDGNEFYYVQNARKRLGGHVHLVVSWRLQDDGWTPYPVISVSKYIRFNPDMREGVGVISLDSIYPMGIPNLVKIIEQIENHSEELYRIQ